MVPERSYNVEARYLLSEEMRETIIKKAIRAAFANAIDILNGLNDEINFEYTDESARIVLEDELKEIYEEFREKDQEDEALEEAFELFELTYENTLLENPLIEPDMSRSEPGANHVFVPSTSFPILDFVYTSREAAHEYDLSQNTVTQWCNRGRFTKTEARKSHGTWLVSKAAMEERLIDLKIDDEEDED